MRVRYLIALLAAAVLAYLLAWPTDRTFPTDDTLADAPPRTGVLAENSALADLARTATAGDGPEDIAFASDGTLYTGTADGAIQALAPGADRWRAITTTYGRPLGLAFDPDERFLYVADAERGLMRTDREGHLERLVDSLDGEDLGLVDDLAVGPDGAVYFTTASAEFAWDDHERALLAHHPTGKLLRYDPTARRLDLLADSLHFANGVAIAPDAEAVLVAETGAYRIRRYGLRGVDSAALTTFADNLPGFPDGIAYDRHGLLWVALANPRNPLLDWLLPRPLLREAVYRVPARYRPSARPHGWIVALDTAGRIVESLEDPAGDYSTITNVLWRGDTAYLGSLTEWEIGKVVRPSRQRPEPR